MGALSYALSHKPAGVLIATSGGLLFGSFMAWYQRRSEKRLQRRGLNTDDMAPRQKKTIPLPLSTSDALLKAEGALASLRKLKKSSIQVVASQITATTGTTWESFGERITVDVTADAAASVVRICSRPRVATTVMDGGKGRENVELFATVLASQCSRTLQPERRCSGRAAQP